MTGQCVRSKARIASNDYAPAIELGIKMRANDKAEKKKMKIREIGDNN